MAKDTETSVESKTSFKNLTNARCHCEFCKGRFCRPIDVKSSAKKGDKTSTVCPRCKKSEVKSFLTFDSLYKTS